MTLQSISVGVKSKPKKSQRNNLQFANAMLKCKYRTKGNKMNEYFEYLTNLRDGGSMNMMWAPTMLQANFDLSVKESREVFSKWCESLKGN